VHFALTAEQQAFASSIRSLLQNRFGPEYVRAVFEDAGADGHLRQFWMAAAEQGWLSVTVPPEFDGLGLGILDASVIARELGAATAPGPWHPTVLGTEALRLARNDDLGKTWLPRIACGHVVIAVATRAPGGSWDACGAAVEATTDGVLQGAADQVEYAHVADLLITASRDGRLWLVDPNASGVRITRVDTLDRTTRLARVEFDAVRGDALSDDPDALGALYRIGAVLAANDLAGNARAALGKTVSYVGQREQFGRPVGSFQAIKHHLASLHVGVTMAEHAALYAAHALDTDAIDGLRAVSIAKAKASDVARETTAAMIQYFGGIGYTWEHDAHFAFKRAKRMEYLYGDGTWHRARLADLILDERT
jgi:alkylation response protein AidB-like acyl-CoA dehydrogenase